MDIRDLYDLLKIIIVTGLTIYFHNDLIKSSTKEAEEDYQGNVITTGSEIRMGIIGGLAVVYMYLVSIGMYPIIPIIMIVSGVYRFLYLRKNNYSVMDLNTWVRTVYVIEFALGLSILFFLISMFI